MKIAIDVKKLTIIIFALCLATSNLQAMFNCCPKQYDIQKTAEMLLSAIENRDCERPAWIIKCLKESDQLVQLLEYVACSYQGGILAAAVDKGYLGVMEELFKPEIPIALRKKILCSVDSWGTNGLMRAVRTNCREVVEIVLQAARANGCLKEVLTASDMANQTALSLAAHNGDPKITKIISEATLSTSVYETPVNVALGYTGK